MRDKGAQKRAGQRWRAKNMHKVREWDRARRKRHPEAVVKFNIERYGITIPEFEQMVVAQGGLCAICRRPELVTRKGKPLRLHIDHNHKTGKVRGLLCMRCNFGLGYFQDDPLLLRAATAYVERQN